MTTGIVFHFEPFDKDVFSGRQIDFDGWRYACKAFGIEQMAIIDLVPGGFNYINADTSFPFKFYSSLESFETEHAIDTLLYFETSWTFPEELKPIRLDNFIHPQDNSKNIWYIFGPAIGFRPCVGDNKTWISVPQKNNIAMHSLHLAPIVLYDRYVKT